MTESKSKIDTLLDRTYDMNGRPICSECGEILWSTDGRRKTCSKRCSKHRQARMKKIYMLRKLAKAWKENTIRCHNCGIDLFDVSKLIDNDDDNLIIDFNPFNLFQGGHLDGNGGIHRRFVINEYMHRFGNSNRRRVKHQKNYTGAMNWWLRQATDEEIQEWNYRIECVLCNSFHAVTGIYPNRTTIKMLWGNGSIVIRYLEDCSR